MIDLSLLAYDDCFCSKQIPKEKFGEVLWEGWDGGGRGRVMMCHHRPPDVRGEKRQC